MRGRKPKPVELLKLTGNYREDRHGDAFEIDADNATQPKGLPRDVAAVWRQYASTLRDNNLLKCVDGPVFEIFAREFARWRRLEKMVKDTGGEVIVVAGVPKTNPALKEAQRARDAMLVAAREFGMTPCARRNVQPSAGRHTDNAGAVLNRLRKRQPGGRDT